MSRRWLRLGGAVAGIGLVVWLVARDADAIESLRDLAAAQVAVILVLQVAYLLTESVRMEVVVEQTAGVPLSSWWWLRIFLGGRLINLVVPQGGNVYRALALKEVADVRYATFGGGIGAFLWLNVTLNLAIASALTAWRPPDTDLVGLDPWLGLGLAAAAAGAAPLLVRVVLHRVPARGKVLDAARTVADTIASGLSRPLLVRFLAVWSVTLAVILFLYGAVLDAVGVDLGPGEVVALYALVQVASFVVITPGNLGIQELGFAGLAGLFGVPVGQGAAAAAIIRATGLVALVGMALPTGYGALRRFVTESRHAPTD